MNKDWLRNLVTSKDKKTHDIAKWSWLVTTISTIAGSAWNGVHNGTVDVLQFAQAIGIISGAHGAAVMMKKDTDPDVQPPSIPEPVQVSSPSPSPSPASNGDGMTVEERRAALRAKLGR